MNINASNERVKHAYFDFLREARQLGPHSIEQAAKALDRFETYTKRKGFREFRIEQAKGFKRDLDQQRARRTGDKLTRATVASTLNALREFFEWLSSQRGYRSRFSRTDAAYFKPTRADETIARAPRQRRVPTLDQVRAIISAMPATNDIERRDQAIVALIIVTGARDNAVASLKLRHLDTADRHLFQDGRDVRTKFRKTLATWFFPVGEDLISIVTYWKAYLVSHLSFSEEDPLFPQTCVAFTRGGNEAPARLARVGWANADPIRAIFKRACKAAGLPPFTPHSFRHTLAILGEEICDGPAAFKAWSQNLGHKDVLVTFTSYGTLPEQSQRRIILGLAKPSVAR